MFNTVKSKFITITLLLISASVAIPSIFLMNQFKENFEQRKAQNRPEHHPSSLHPKLARALINLTQTTSSILDPMCGSGGILIEAGLMKLKPIGYDIDQIQINRSRINLSHFKIKNYTL